MEATTRYAHHHCLRKGVPERQSGDQEGDWTLHLVLEHNLNPLDP